MGWGSSARRGGGRKVRALPRKFVFFGFRRDESGMSKEICRDVPDPWGCSKSLCKKKVRAHFFVPYGSHANVLTHGSLRPPSKYPICSICSGLGTVLLLCLPKVVK